MDFVLHSNRKKIINSKGAAIVEFVISLLFIVPLFISVPIIAKYIAVKHKNIESGRYAIWERTIWSSYAGQWKDNENIKSDNQLEIEVDVRFYGSQIQGFANRKPTKNQFWVNFNSESMIERSKNKKSVILKSSIDYSPVKNDFADEIAYEGNSFLVRPREYRGNKCLASKEGKSGSSLNLGAHAYSTTEVAANVTSITIPGVSMQNTRNYIFKNNGAILSNAWTAPTTKEFNERVTSLTLNSLVKCIAQPAGFLSKIPIYKEGEASAELGDWDLSFVTGDGR